ncbi:hypothetical protein OHA84_02070 [Streptomyces sp. NBC_00513]|uniref:hypothetical protein n=1 Tax=unclassified Streptomyces TaxID=2593676 RepID=UPI002250BB80|nr:hypothetical protein [Streptomyces sp. NBC_00424]MCX5079057.1 hypothetical protein [Streptomyces sp. NBC_00424]WUD39376.1 hypothetical protein OHA84_02070 [Streptomyces sp. NBC_00513]
MNILSKKTVLGEATDTSGLVPADYRLPLWFFAFEGVLAAAFDILKAFPAAWPVLVLLLTANITISLTLMRKRIKLAKALWRGKETRRVALALIALRIGGHFALNALGLAVTSTLGHVLFALVMAAATIGLLAYSQAAALRALTTTAATPHSTGTHASAV